MKRTLSILAILFAAVSSAQVGVNTANGVSINLRPTMPGFTLGTISFDAVTGGINISGGNVGIGTTTPTSRIHGSTTLSAATGDEVAYRLDYTTNKATSGNDTGLLISMTDTASPGTSYPLAVYVEDTKTFSVSAIGDIDSAYGDLKFTAVEVAGAPTLAESAEVGLLDGTYYYRVSFVNAHGETEGGHVSGPLYVNLKKIDITNIPVSADTTVTARKIYRSPAYGGALVMKLVATIPNNIETTYTDNIADAALGAGILWRNTTGGSLYSGANIIGYQSLHNTAWGRDAGGTGHGETVVGSFAGSGTTAAYTTAVGWRAAMDYGALGHYVTAIGGNAGISGTAGSLTAIGYNAGNSNTGAASTIVGVTAGAFNAGDYLTAVGFHALERNAGANNTAIGYNAGSTPGGVADNANTSGSQNTWVGVETGSTSTTQHVNSTAIGYRAMNNADNQVVLGNASVTEVQAGMGGVASVKAASVSCSPTISTGTEAPSTTPAKVGDMFVDTTNHKLYFADCATSSACWVIAN